MTHLVIMDVLYLYVLKYNYVLRSKSFSVANENPTRIRFDQIHYPMELIIKWRKTMNALCTPIMPNLYCPVSDIRSDWVTFGGSLIWLMLMEEVR